MSTQSPSVGRVVALSVAVLVLAAAAAFALVPFEAATHHSSVSGSLGTAAAENASTGLDGEVAVFVDGPGWISGAVGHYLVGDLRAAGVTATQVRTLRGVDGPVLAVRVTRLDAEYWPVSPSATVGWRFVYASTGNATYVREQLASPGGPAVNASGPGFVAEGEYVLRHDVRGVVSIPAYRGVLADRVAATTARELLAAAGR